MDPGLLADSVVRTCLELNRFDESYRYGLSGCLGSRRWLVKQLSHQSRGLAAKGNALWTNEVMERQFAATVWRKGAW